MQKIKKHPGMGLVVVFHNLINIKSLNGTLIFWASWHINCFSLFHSPHDLQLVRHGAGREEAKPWRESGSKREGIERSGTGFDFSLASTPLPFSFQLPGPSTQSREVALFYPLPKSSFHFPPKSKFSLCVPSCPSWINIPTFPAK
jgi:hypothetical protein